MQKQPKILFLISLLIIIAFASIPLWHIDLGNLDHKPGEVTRIKKKVKKQKVVHKVTWGYPFERLYEKVDKNSVRQMF